MRRTLILMLGLVMAVWVRASRADPYDDTIELFKNAGESAAFFDDSYGYARFPDHQAGAGWSWAPHTAAGGYSRKASMLPTSR